MQIIYQIMRGQWPEGGSGRVGRGGRERKEVRPGRAAMLGNSTDCDDFVPSSNIHMLPSFTLHSLTSFIHLIFICFIHPNFTYLTDTTFTCFLHSLPFACFRHSPKIHTLHSSHIHMLPLFYRYSNVSSLNIHMLPSFTR